MSHIFLPVIIKPSKYICSLDILTICWLFYYDFFLIRGKMQIGIFSFPSAKKNLGAWTLCLFFSYSFYTQVSKQILFFPACCSWNWDLFVHISVSEIRLSPFPCCKLWIPIFLLSFKSHKSLKISSCSL